jgi:hypothetical protein
MKDIITPQQVAQNLKKFQFTSFDDDVHEKIQLIHQKVIRQELKHHLQQARKQEQQGGRVAFPIDYFGSSTNSYTSSVPSFTNLSPTQTHIRPSIMLNDPSSVLGTERGVLSGMVGGKKTLFQIPKKHHEQGVREVLKQVNASKHKVVMKKLQDDSKQKFEKTMDDVLTKVSKSTKQHHLRIEDLDKVLEQKKYKAFQSI